MAADIPPEGPEETPAAAPRPLKGILLVIFATLAFALADSLTKDLASRHPVTVVLAIRYLFNVGLLVLFLGPRLGPRLWRTQRTGLVILRGSSLAIASLGFAMALQVMPIAETVAIVYLAPILVMLLAIPLLGEKVGIVGWISAAAGFAGVLLIARPGGGLDPVGVALALSNACLTAGYHLLSRSLARTETTIAMLFHTGMVGSVIFSVASVGFLAELSLPLVDLAQMALLGALSTVGHFMFTAAYREAPASLLAPVNYLHLVWAGGLGYFIFGHLPDILTTTGMLLVCAAGVTLAVWSYVGRER
ncbi:MAG: DMT family transporter [Rhizobiaceae bacterium]